MDLPSGVVNCIGHEPMYWDPRNVDDEVVLRPPRLMWMLFWSFILILLVQFMRNKDASARAVPKPLCGKIMDRKSFLSLHDTDYSIYPVPKIIKFWIYFFALSNITRTIISTILY